MPAHIKASLTGSSLVLPVRDGRLALGTWQGIYLCEHRDSGGPRRRAAHGLRGAVLSRVRTYVPMRWDNLKVEAEEGRRLPGYQRARHRRTFDAPEALDIRFYEVQAKSVLNKVPERSRMPFRWTINPYQGLHPCVQLLLRSAHPHLSRLQRGRDFEREIVVKVNAPEVARTELMQPRGSASTSLSAPTPIRTSGSRAGTSSCRGSGRRCATRARRARCSPSRRCCCATSSCSSSCRGSFAANLSVPTLDEKAWRATEPHTPHPRKRLEAVAELNRPGIPCGILIAPLMPGVNDSPEQVERDHRARHGGRRHDIGGICLHLRGEVKEIWWSGCAPTGRT